MNNFQHSISQATILKEEHINYKVIVHPDNIITLEREIQGAVNLKHMVLTDFYMLYLY